MKLWLKIFLALVIGMITGLILGPHAEIFKPIGTLFLNSINMLVVLLVLSSMTVGISNIQEPHKLGRLGIKSLTMYAATTVIAIVIGIALGTFFDLGGGLHLVRSDSGTFNANVSLKDMFMSIIPSNPIAAMAQGHMLQVIVFSVFLGVAINFAGEKGKPLLELMESLADVMYRLTSIVMEFSPIGVFAIMATVAGTFGTAVILPLLKFLAVYYLACGIHVLVIFLPILRFMAKVSPWPFFKGMKDAIVLSFSTASSSATLPVSMHCLQENLGVSKSITRFIMPLGTSINMNGAAIYKGMAAIFIATAFGLELDWYGLLTIIIIGTVAAIGAAGIPGSGLIMLSVVVTSVGLPIEGLGLLAGIDRFRDMISTVLNMLGDSITAVWVAKGEGELDERRYYHSDLVELESKEL